MTSEERVLAAFEFRPVDRVPRFDVFMPGYEARWRAAHPEWDGRDIFDRYSSIDIGIVYPDQYGPFLEGRGAAGEAGGATLERDSWGRLLARRDGAYFEDVRGVVLGDKGALDSLRFGPPDEPGRFDELHALARRFGRRFCPVSGVLGLFMGSCRLRGQEQLLVDLAEDRAFARALAERLAGYTTAVGLRVAREMRAAHTALWLYDELGAQRGPLLSPAAFEAVYLEPYRRMIGAWKAAGIPRVVLHCDGNALPLLDLLAAAGVDGLMPVAPSAGTWLPEVRARWGRRFILVGGMDNVHTLPGGDRRRILAQAAAILEAARDGGVIVGSHSIDEDVPVDAYDAYDAFMNGQPGSRG